MNRRQALRVLSTGIAALPFSANAAVHFGGDVDVTGTSSSLSFELQAAPDGRTVTQDEYRGMVVLLYFGYTFCPDVCPLTLQNIASTLIETGNDAKHIRCLFVTVDPGRDTLPVLTNYVGLFGPDFVGLRGDADELQRLARRYRIAYSVTPSDDPEKYEVSHSSVVYVFDRQGDARLLVPSMASQTPDIKGLAADLVRLTNERPGWMDWLRELV
jgi:protein SCO1/2